MNIEPLVKFAAGLMEAAARKNVGKLVLCYDGQKLICIPSERFDRKFVSLFVFRAEDWPKGLNAKEWNQVRSKIGTLTEELNLCLEKMLNNPNAKQPPSRT